MLLKLSETLGKMVIFIVIKLYSCVAAGEHLMNKVCNSG